jgi:CBS domain containing-hemolysin-like protein
VSVPLWLPLAMSGLLVMSAGFSATETALFSLEPLEMKRRTECRGLLAAALTWCLRHPRSVLVTILLSNLAVNTLYFALAGHWAAEVRGAATTLVPLAALAALVLLGEILPKALALSLAGPLASAVAPAVRVWAWLLSPVRVPLDSLVQYLAARVRRHPTVTRALSEAELEEMVKRNPERFGLGRRTANVVGELVGLVGLQVRDVMTPFVDVTPVTADVPVSVVLSRVLDDELRWLLVREADRVEGFVDAKDLLVADPEASVGSLMRPLQAIPELARLPHLLQLFRDAQVDHVLVVDEYGNEAGVVGRDDLTESIVGGLLRAEHEASELPVRLRPQRGWEVVASLGVHEFEDLFAVRLPRGRNRTIGGLVVEQMGRIPEAGDLVDLGGLPLEVLGVSRGRVMKVLVRFAAPAVEAAAGEEER